MEENNRKEFVFTAANVAFYIDKSKYNWIESRTHDPEVSFVYIKLRLKSLV